MLRALKYMHDLLSSGNLEDEKAIDLQITLKSSILSPDNLRTTLLVRFIWQNIVSPKILCKNEGVFLR